MIVAADVEPRREAAPRSARRLGFPDHRPLPTAQGCTRTIVLSIMAPEVSRSAVQGRVSSSVSNTSASPQSQVGLEQPVALALFIGQVPPLRRRPGDPQHALEARPAIARRPTAASPLGVQQRPNRRPLLARRPDPVAPCHPHKTALISHRLPRQELSTRQIYDPGPVKLQDDRSAINRLIEVTEKWWTH